MNVKQVLGNRVLVEFDPDPEFSPDGIFIPIAFRKPSAFGVVVAVGTNRKGRGCGMLAEVNVGDRVRVDRNMGSAPAGDNRRIVSILDIQCVLLANGNGC